MKSGTLWRVAVSWTALIATQSASGQVDCTNPDNLCTGDPCIVETVEVLSPCVVDFGARTLSVEGTVFVPNAGVLDWTADQIDLTGRIKGKHTKSTAGDGAHVTLTANNDLSSAGKIDVSGRFSAGSIALIAGNDLSVTKALLGKSRGGGATAPGASVLVQAGGTLTGSKRAKIKVKGRRSTDGGQVELSGDAGVTWEGKIDVRGLNAGSVSATAVAGDVAMEGDVRADALEAAGGSASFVAGGDVIVLDVDAQGGTNGGSIVVSGDTVSNLGIADVDGVVGGSIDVSATGAIFAGKLSARGKTAGSTVSVVGGGSVEIVRIAARTGVGSAPTISVAGMGGVAVGDIRADGRDNGGQISIESGDPMNPGSGPPLTIDDHVTASGVDVSGGRIDAFSFGGDAVIGAHTASKFLVEGPVGGTIEMIAVGNLTATGQFTAQTGGCIALAAAGTLDISGATFDVPLSIDCP